MQSSTLETQGEKYSTAKLNLQMGHAIGLAKQAATSSAPA